MTKPIPETTDHMRLRLSPDDVAMLWGILDGHREKSSGAWPRLDRILFDLDVAMRKQEQSTDAQH